MTSSLRPWGACRSVMRVRMATADSRRSVGHLWRELVCDHLTLRPKRCQKNSHCHRLSTGRAEDKQKVSVSCLVTKFPSSPFLTHLLFSLPMDNVVTELVAQVVAKLRPVWYLRQPLFSFCWGGCQTLSKEASGVFLGGLLFVSDV